MATQFSVERIVLVEWMTAIGKAFTFSGQLHDIFKCVVIKLDNESEEPADLGLQIEVADGISYVHITNIPHEKKSYSGPVEFALYADTLQKILSASNKSRIHFDLDDAASMVVIKTEGRYKIPCITTESFPKAKKIDCEMKPFGDLNFVDTLDKMTPFAAKELARPELAGVSVATHVYVSTVGTHGAVHPREEGVLDRMTISPYAIKFLNSLNRSKLGEVTFGANESLFVIKSPSFFYTCRLPETEFPWGSLDTVMKMRTEFAFKVLVDSAVLHSALRRVLLLDTDKFTQLGIQFGANSLRLFCNSQMTASTSAEELEYAEKIRLPEGADFQALEVRLGVSSVDAFRRLFDELDGAPIMFTVINDRSPVFIQQRGSRYMFYTQVLRAL